MDDKLKLEDLGYGDFFESNRGVDGLPVARIIAEHKKVYRVKKTAGEYLLDLDYNEDSKAEIDMNVIMTDTGKFIEVQGTGEEHPFTEDELQKLISYAKIGIENIVAKQKEIIA